MNEKNDFEKLQMEIIDLSDKDKLKRIIEAKTNYLQNVNPSEFGFKTEIPFDEKCDLEISKIKEIMKI